MAIIYDFEDGTLSPWVDDSGNFGIVSSPARGTYSAGEGVSSEVLDIAHVSPSELSGGKRVDYIEFYYQESSNSWGGGLAIEDSSGNEVISVATNNPQWDIHDGNGWNEAYGGEGYDRWCRVKIIFDWSAGTADIEWEDLSSGYSDTYTGRPLISNTDVETLRIKNNCPFSTGDHYMWYDDFTIPLPVLGVETDNPSNITATSFDGNGDIISTGGTNADERGFVYDTTSYADPGNTSPSNSNYGNVENETGSFGTGTYSLTVSSLSTDTLYYCRAYAHNSDDGYVYGGEIFVRPPSSDWSFYHELPIDGATTDYQMKLDIRRGSGTNDPANGVIYEEVHCAYSDMRDTRVCDDTNNDSGTSQLPMWAEEVDSRVKRVVWVKTDGSSTLYLYAGNTSVSAYSDGDATYPLFFEDPEDQTVGDTPSGWTQEGGSDICDIYDGDAVTGSKSIKVIDSLSEDNVAWKSFGQNEQITIYGYINNKDNNDSAGVFISSTADGSLSSWCSRMRVESGVFTVGSTSGGSPSSDTWYKFKLKIDGNTDTYGGWFWDLNGNLEFSSTGESFDSAIIPEYMKIISFYNHSDERCLYDALRVGTYASTEPSWGFASTPNWQMFGVTYQDSGLRIYNGSEYIKVGKRDSPTSDDIVYLYDGNEYIRPAIVSINDTDASCVYIYDGSSWKCLVKVT